MEPTTHAALATLDRLSSSGDHVQLIRLGRALLHEIEWRASWPPPPLADEPAAPMPVMGAASMVLPPDPSAALYTHEGRRVPIAEATLPTLGSLEATRFACAVHVFCCSSAIAAGRLDDVERHAQMGLAVCTQCAPDDRPPVGAMA